MDLFLSCDWGTSSFRLRLVRPNGPEVLAEAQSGDGIAHLFQKWTAGQAPEAGRTAFYQSYLHGQIKKLESSVGYPLQHLTLVVSGMASSSIGMLELPYKESPFRADGSDLTVQVMEPSPQLPNKTVLVSGAKAGNDVMRGEETMLVGCMGKNEAERVYIFPGTHSKHVWVVDGVVRQFKTYMTGELFGLLATRSILSNSVKADAATSSAAMEPYFEKGILEGASSNLLNAAFHVRTAALFHQHTPAQNYQYLSGLVIGAELGALRHQTPPPLSLVSGGALSKSYERGLRVLGLAGRLQTVDADRALIEGQLAICNGRV